MLSQGVMRRGMSVDALRAFILSQGASRRTVLVRDWERLLMREPRSPY
jgi:hypothetical protein